ncbi:hypothetical protein Q3G72_022784 [Acer saccharum]|nr:hypothetical protein Q3G72_022784 [Acer saccharum]
MYGVISTYDKKFMVNMYRLILTLDEKFMKNMHGNLNVGGETYPSRPENTSRTSPLKKPSQPDAADAVGNRRSVQPLKGTKGYLCLVLT